MGRGNYSGRRWRGFGRRRRDDGVQVRVESLLPMGEGIVEIYIAIHAIKEADSAKRGKFIVKVNAELAEMLVVRIAESEYAIGEILVSREVFDTELFIEWLDRIRRVAVTVGAGDEDGVAFLGQSRRCVVFKRCERSDMTLRPEFFGDFACETFSSSRLRGIENGDLQG